ncbi:DUF6232 family protein [Streptomyces termitum]|uniref:Uncharacterized protein n=1 Tax=Streptomyces termitum TaxID=67368 RepID=A0A918W854_9ACTN|nr:DUF6232 family protein [Streptomyces termitum]GHA84350.1 hypothetical protein GCM10010305_30110 [Streptomyces termitum]
MRQRMLWVGAAAFPLHNLSRIEAFRLKPDRSAILLDFLKWLAIAAVVYVAISVTSGGNPPEELRSPLLVITLGLGVFFLARLFTAAKPILAVETAGGSLIAVTLPDMNELLAIAGRIVHAIDHPGAEFTRTVFQISNYNGPVVQQRGNMNTGFRG